jgi:hypothetical protein
MKVWSIALGHNGAVNEEFVKKYKSVMKVRKNVMKDIYISILSLIGFLGIYLIALNSNNDFIYILQYPTYIFMGISALSIFAHLKIVVEWKNHDLKMLEEFYGQCNFDYS